MRLLFATLALLCSHLAVAKCESVDYNVEGLILTADGKGIAEAVVEALWMQYERPKKLSVLTGPDGHYSLKIAFDAISPPNSKTKGLYECAARLERITITASKDGKTKNSAVIDSPEQKLKVDIRLPANRDRTHGG